MDCLLPINLKSYTRLLIILFGLFVLLNAPCQAQNYITGFVVELSGDTISGTIDHTEWDTSPDWIDFKPNGTGEAVRYSSKDIAAFKLHSLDWIYVAKTVILDISPRLVDRLRTEKEPETIEKDLFLQVLEQGDVNLYYYKHPSEKQHYFIENDEIPIQELVYYRYLKLSDENKVIGKPKRSLVEDEKYRGQLNYALKKCPKVGAFIAEMDFEYADFRKLFEQYNECVGNGDAHFSAKKSNFQSKRQRRRLDFGLIGGLNQTSIIFPETSLTSDKLIFRAANNLVHGLFFSRPLSNNGNGSAYHTDLVLKPMVATLRHQDENGTTNEFDQYSINKLYLKSNHLIKIQPIDRPINPYISVGGSVAFALISTEDLTLDQDVANRFGYLLQGRQALELGMIGAIGVQSPLFFLECRYEITNGVSQHMQGLDSRTSGIGLFAGVYLSEFFPKMQETSRRNRHKIQQKD